MTEPDDDVPEAVRKAFEGRPYLTPRELAPLLGVNVVTLRRHTNAGDIPWRQIGMGTASPRRVYTLADVRVFWRQQKRIRS